MLKSILPAPTIVGFKKLEQYGDDQASIIAFGSDMVGPSSIRGGRLAYNEAINDTNNQQMLMILVQRSSFQKGQQ